jgi:hypothetical protein
MPPFTSNVRIGSILPVPEILPVDGERAVERLVGFHDAAWIDNHIAIDRAEADERGARDVNGARNASCTAHIHFAAAGNSDRAESERELGGEHRAGDATRSRDIELAVRTNKDGGERRSRAALDRDSAVTGRSDR